jgi:hypothetical protein
MASDLLIQACRGGSAGGGFRHQIVARRQPMRFAKIVGLPLVAGLALATPSAAAPIPIAGYDINDAVISGHGFWAHSYGGTITPGVGFFNNTFPGTTATYSGVGGGTLNDGIIGTLETNTQLFVAPQATDGTLISPAIFLTLSFAYTITELALYGGDIPTNAIPGTLTGVTVTISGPMGTQSDTFALDGTTAFGPATNSNGELVNDRIVIPNTSPLFGLPAFTVTLSDFQGGLANWFSLTEVTLDGARFVGVPVPAPGSVLLLSLGLFALGAAKRRTGMASRVDHADPG